MKKIFITLLSSLFLFSCVTPEPEIPIAGKDLQGEWFMDLGEGEIIIYNFSGDGKISKTLVTPWGDINTYQEGYYTIDNKNIVSYMQVYDTTSNNWSTGKVEWEFVSLNNQILSLKTNDVLIELRKLFYEIDLDLSKKEQFSLTQFFADETIFATKSYDESIATSDKNAIAGIMHGSTCVSIYTQEGSEYIFRVNVKSNGIGAFWWLHKLLDVPFESVPTYWGEPESRYNDTDMTLWIYKVNGCEVRVWSDEYVNLVYGISIKLTEEYPASLFTEQLYYSEKYDTYFDYLKGDKVLVEYEPSRHVLYLQISSLN